MLPIRIQGSVSGVWGVFMRGSLDDADAGTIEIDGLKSQHPDGNVIVPAGREVLGPIAKVIWPRNTAAHLASIARKDVRTAARWISGEVQPPPIVYSAIHTVMARW